jgi:hypothetical protein
MYCVLFSAENDREKCEIIGPSKSPLYEDIKFCFLLLKDFMKYDLLLFPVNRAAKSGEGRCKIAQF